MKKKLIGFNDELLEEIGKYAEDEAVSFSEAVRRLVINALNELKSDNVQEEQGDAVDFPSLVHTVDELSEKINKLTKDMSWWNADENESKVGNVKVQVDELEKRINVLTRVSKLFKSHIKDRGIHLQDG